jgi:hypothetical protein
VVGDVKGSRGDRQGYRPAADGIGVPASPVAIVMGVTIPAIADWTGTVALEVGGAQDPAPWPALPGNGRLGSAHQACRSRC